MDSTDCRETRHQIGVLIPLFPILNLKNRHEGDSSAELDFLLGLCYLETSTLVLVNHMEVCMLTCNRCGKKFNVNEKPGALLFSHPADVTRASVVTKYHICQECEAIILAQFTLP